MNTRKLIAALAIMLILPALFARPASAYQTEEQKKRQKQMEEDAQYRAGLKPPPLAPGLQITLRARLSKFNPGAPAVIAAAFKNVTNSPITIKNEFMTAYQQNISFIRVFIDQKESAGAEMFRRRMLVRDGESLINLAPGKEVEVLEYEFYNLPTGAHSIYVSYSSQVFNYERKQQRWWLGTSNSNIISIRVTQPDIQKKITNTGNQVIKNILSDLKALADSYGELRGVGTSLKAGTGVFPDVAQISFSGGSLAFTIQVRGVDESLKPYPEYDTKYPYIGVNVICYYSGGSTPVLRNAIFKSISNRAQAFNKVTKDVSGKKAMDIVAVNNNVMNLVSTADLIIQATVVSAVPEIQENGEQLWVVTVTPKKKYKGTSGDSVVFYTDSPTVRFKGAFIGRQFIIFLDLKYREPVTYNLLGAEPVSPDTQMMIEQKLNAQNANR